MSAEVEEEAIATTYRVVSVEKSEAPEGLPGDNWCRYIIGQGSARIEGFKPGTVKAVTAHAEAVAEDLNLRATRGNSAYAARRRK